MRALKLPVQVTKNHTLQLQLPEDIGEGPVEVIVLVPDAGENLAEQDRAEPSAVSNLSDFLASARIDHRFIHSKEDIDDYLRTERESWE